MQLLGGGGDGDRGGGGAGVGVARRSLQGSRTAVVWVVLKPVQNIHSQFTVFHLNILPMSMRNSDMMSPSLFL